MKCLVIIFSHHVWVYFYAGSITMHQVSELRKTLIWTELNLHFGNVYIIITYLSFSIQAYTIFKTLFEMYSLESLNGWKCIAQCVCFRDSTIIILWWGTLFPCIKLPWYWALNPLCLWLLSDIKCSLSQFLLLIIGGGRFIPDSLQKKQNRMSWLLSAIFI